MNINVYDTKVICSNPESLHNYFAWPSIARLQDGRLAMVASGFRIAHVCPFGKAVICYSNDEGKTWTRPLPIIDTPLDDRDAGIVPFGEQGILVTSFNNDIAVQKRYHPDLPYNNAYLDHMLSDELVQKYWGSTFAVSFDGGVTFGPVGKLPITSPHGPLALDDGSFLYVGTYFDVTVKRFPKDRTHLGCYQIWADGRFEKLSKIENIEGMTYSCEPHAIRLKDGTIIVHIRAERKKPDSPKAFTIYQCESYDGGISFTKPHPILSETGGAPAHLLQLKDGTLISAYGYREQPYGIRVMFSRDNGQTWDTDNILYTDAPSRDLGYPASVELEDGKIYTVFYCHEKKDGPAVIMATVWDFEH